MGFLNLKSLLISAVVVLSVTEANIFQIVETKLGRVASSSVMKDVFRHDVRPSLLLSSSIRRWAPLRAAVKHMAIPLSLISPQENRQTILTDSKIKSSGFSWASCGPSNQLVEIRNLSITPSPLYFPGPLNFGFDIVFHDTILYNAKVSASLQLQYSSREGEWVTIPCIGQIGSCTYDDVCSLSQAIPCPDPLKSKGIPCTCPFNKGEYILPNFSVEVDASLFISGDYKAKAVFTHSQKGMIACYNVTFTVG